MEKGVYSYERQGVTVGIPFYSGSDVSFLKLAIDSILGQTLKPDYVHLIQDGPVSAEITDLIASYLKLHRNIKHLRIAENKGLPYALNYSILQAFTRYYARMDSDDLAHPERLEKQIEFMEANPDISILGTDALEFSDDPYIEDCFLKRMPVESVHVNDFFHYRNPLVHSSVVFRCSVFAMIGLYDVNYRKNQDLQFWARSLRMKVGITNLSEPLIYFRVGDMPYRRSSAKNLIWEIKARYSFNTWSPRLNLLKLFAVLFRLTPVFVRKWGYRRLR